MANLRNRSTGYVCGLVLGIVVLLATPQVAEAGPPGPMTKMGRGLKNIAIAIFDIPATIGRSAHEDSPIYALSFGIFEGFGNAAYRAVSGFVEIIASPFPRYDVPLYDRRLGESPLGRYKQ